LTGTAMITLHREVIVNYKLAVERFLPMLHMNLLSQSYFSKSQMLKWLGMPPNWILLCPCYKWLSVRSVASAICAIWRL